MAKRDYKEIAAQVVEEIKKEGLFPDKILLVPDLAKMLGCSKQCIYNRIDELPTHKWGGKHHFFQSEIIKMLKR